MFIICLVHCHLLFVYSCIGWNVKYTSHAQMRSKWPSNWLLTNDCLFHASLFQLTNLSIISHTTNKTLSRRNKSRPSTLMHRVFCASFQGNTLQESQGATRKEDPTRWSCKSPNRSTIQLDQTGLFCSCRPKLVDPKPSCTENSDYNPKTQRNNKDPTPTQPPNGPRFCKGPSHATAPFFTRETRRVRCL